MSNFIITFDISSNFVLQLNFNEIYLFQYMNLFLFYFL